MTAIERLPTHLRPRTIFVKCLGPTNYRPSRIKFVDYSSGESVTIVHSYEGNSLEQAVRYLESIDMSIRCSTNDVPHPFHALIVADWSDISIKG